jgi:hypothetical protein
MRLAITTVLMASFAALLRRGAATRRGFVSFFFMASSV